MTKFMAGAALLAMAVPAQAGDLCDMFSFRMGTHRVIPSETGVPMPCENYDWTTRDVAFPQAGLGFTMGPRHVPDNFDANAYRTLPEGSPFPR